MTCVAAIARDGIVYMAADSGCSHGSLIEQTGVKLWVRGEMLIGQSGTVRACQVAQYKFVPPPLIDDLEAYFATVFWDALGPLIDKDDHLDLLVGVRGRIFHVHPGGSVTFDLSVPYSAIGEGAPVALGAMYPIKESDPPDVLRWAMEATEKHCVSIRSPFVYLQTKECGP